MHTYATATTVTGLSFDARDYRDAILRQGGKLPEGSTVFKGMIGDDITGDSARVIVDGKYATVLGYSAAGVSVLYCGDSHLLAMRAAHGWCIAD